MKQLINKACQLKLQPGVFGATCLFISYNIKANRNGLDNHIGHHTQKVYVTTAVSMPEQAEL